MLKAQKLSCFFVSQNQSTHSFLEKNNINACSNFELGFL